jgi:hypothetical protein
VGVGAAPAGSELVEIGGEGAGRIGTIRFDFANADRAGLRSTSVEGIEFRASLYREIKRLEQWAADLNWPAVVPDLQVVVSDQYTISKSLVPAWSGRAGHMEFPVRRIVAGEAAIMHELVHTLFPNGNRFLAEGLAVYLQAAIGGNPAFPNFGTPLHEQAGRLFLETAAPDSANSWLARQRLEGLDLARLDALATPSRLRLTQAGIDGEQHLGAAFTYPIAGSFLQFLIDTRGMDAFRELYTLTPFVPHVQSAGSPERWLGIYGVSLGGLEAEWKSIIATRNLVAPLGEPPDPRTSIASFDNSHVNTERECTNA